MKEAFPTLGLSLLALCSCATATPQTDAFLDSTKNIPEFVQIENIPFIDQTENYCGPTTLSMVMSWAGRPTGVEELVGEVFSPEKDGTLQEALIEASRKRGMLAIPIHGLSNLMHEIAAGHPVIVFENLALSWYPKWHYAVAIGYDLKEGEIILHTGNSAFKHWSLRKFERSWQLGDYWGLLILPPHELSASADELSQADAAAALEDLGYLTRAKTAYTAILKRWPESLSAQVGLGNIAFANSDFQTTARILRNAVKHHPESEAARNNLAVVEKVGGTCSPR